MTSFSQISESTTHPPTGPRGVSGKTANTPRKTWLALSRSHSVTELPTGYSQLIREAVLEASRGIGEGIYCANPISRRFYIQAWVDLGQHWGRNGVRGQLAFLLRENILICSCLKNPWHYFVFSTS